MKNQFYLISKIEGKKFVKHKGDAIRITSNILPYSVDEVVIGVKGQIGKERKVKISNTVTKFLKEWKMACPKSELNLVFPNANGNYMDSQNMMKRRFKPALALAGIDSIRFHDLRHTYASTLIIQQVPLPYISKQLGHSTNKVTLDTYVHLMPESAQLGDSLLENLYEDRDTKQEEVQIRMFGT